MKTNTPILRVSLSFGSGSDQKVEDLAGAVLVNLYGNPAFESPPVPQAALAAAIQAFNDAKDAQAQGGTAATAMKNQRRRELVALLKELASYVQIASDNNQAALLSSGFHMVSTNNSRSALAKPRALRIKLGVSGQLLLTVLPVRNARCYQVEATAVHEDGTPGPWELKGYPTSSRNMPVNGLTPGRIYACRVRAVGGATGVSEWSDVVAHRAL